MRRQQLTRNDAAPAARAVSFETFTINRTGVTRKDTLNGRAYTVVPMVMLAEGVHAGSNGPLYYPDEELSKTPAVWNHKPIVLPDHPVDNSGNGVSACQPHIIERHGVGLILNTKYTKKRGQRGKLKAEAWIEDERLSAVDERLLEAIEAGKTLELSTGVFTDNEEAPGEFGGKAYDAIARNYRPDHLAILLDKKGAFSVKDGAGFLRLNSGVVPRSHLTTNRKSKLSFNAITQQLNTALRERHQAAGDRPSVSLWVEDVYDEHVVFWRDSKLYRNDYTVAANTVELADATEEREVVRVTEYRDAESGLFVGNAGDPANPTEVVMTKTQKVDFLVKNAGWTEADRKFLTSANDKQLDVLVANAKKKDGGKPVQGDGDESTPPEIEDDEAEGTELGKSGKGKTADGDTTGPTKSPPSPQPSVEQEEEEAQRKAEAKKKTNNAAIRQAISEMTPDEFLQCLPGPVRNSVSHGMQLAQQQRASMIETIITNGGDIYTKEELAKMSTDQLAKISALARNARPVEEAVEDQWARFTGSPVRYDGAVGAAPVGNTAEPEPYEAPTINWEEEYANRKKR